MGGAFAARAEVFGSADQTAAKNAEAKRANTLIDSRLDPQKIDIDFINWLGGAGVPIALVLTKIDKIKQSELAKSRKKFETRLLKDWEELPHFSRSRYCRHSSGS